MLKRNLVLLTALVFSSVAQATNLNPGSAITAVTVYNDRASVTRTINVDLLPGASTVVIRGLPGNTMVDSLRVKGESVGRVDIASVEARRSYSKAFNNEQEAQLRNAIETKQDERKAYQDQIEALDLQKAFMKSLVETQPKLMRTEMELGNLDPARWQEAWKLIQSGSSDMLLARSTAVVAQREIDKELSLLQQQLSKLSTGQKQLIDAHIAIEADSKQTATLFLDYQIPGAAWYPMYDARLDTENGALRLDQLASVAQTTGEDWKDIQLTLSTHRPSVSADFNPLTSWYLGFQPVYPSSETNAMMDVLGRQEQRGAVLSAKEMDESYSNANQPNRLAPMKQAEVEAAAFSAEYRIPGKVSISSERNRRKFKIKDQAFDAKLMVLAAPKRSTSAFLHAELRYDGQEPLLPGRVSLFRDDAFVGHTSLALLRPNEELKLSFGVDDAVRVQYHVMPKEHGNRGLIEKRGYVAHQYRTTIHNHHKQAIELRVLDRLPVAQHEDIEVKLSPNTTDPTEVDLDNNSGVLAWDLKLMPGQEKTLAFGYSVSFPADRPLRLADL